jgi:hypothetical protein
MLPNEEERRDLLKLEYKRLHDEIRQRGQNVWLIHSILVTGSLLVAFPIAGNNEPIVSLLLTLVSFVFQLTTLKIDIMCYDQIHYIQKELGMQEPIYPQIRDKLWYKVRWSMWYVLFFISIIMYCVLIYQKHF